MIKRCAVLLGAFTVVFGAAFYCNTYAATSGTTKFSVDVDDTVLELTVPASPAVIDLNPTMTGASFGSTSINVKVATNNITGYQLTMTPTNSQTNTSLIRTELVGSESTYREIETLDLTDPVSTGYPEADFTANRWGYKITGDNYYGIDPNNTTVSHSAWITSEPTNGTNHNLTLAAKVDAETVSGAYETTLNFRAVTNAVVAKDTVTFNGNGADNADAMDSVNIIVNSGESGNLPTNAYTKSGYAFIGWNSANDGSGMTYANEGTYKAVSTDYSHNVVLYAMWEDTSSPIYNILHPDGSGLGSGITISRAYEIAYTAAGKGMWERDEGDRDNDGDTSEYYQVTDGVYHNYDVRWDMQGMTPEICNSITVVHDDYRALDIRNNELYHITKLKDGKCWMTQNLDLNLSTNKSLTDNDTDLNSKTIWTPDSNTIIAASNGNISGFVASSGIRDYVMRSADLGDRYWHFDGTPHGNSCSYFTNDCPSFSLTPFSDNGEHGHLGNFYNWSAAIAENDTSDAFFATEWNNAPNSICPKGWRLPSFSGTQDDDYSGLSSQYQLNGEGLALPPLYFTYGDRTTGGGTSGGSYTWYWTSTTKSSQYAYSFQSRLSPLDGPVYRGTWPRFDGFPVRCIAR